MIKKMYSNVNTIDGIRINTNKGWWLLRASNTQPALIARCEAYNVKDLLTLKQGGKEFIGRKWSVGKRL